MSVRHALLALLSEGPKYGLQLRQEFEARTGEVWPLNVGQVYTTLQRLERDGLVDVRRCRRGAAEGLPHHRPRARRADRLAADAAGHGAAAPRRAAHQGAGRGAGPGRRRARRHAGAPTSPVEVDAALHPGQGRGGRGRRGAGLVADAELFRLEAAVRWLDAGRCPAAERPCPPPRQPRRPDGPRRGSPPPPDRTSDGAGMTAVLELRQVSKIYGEGATEVHALHATSTCVAAGRARRDHGPERVGQEHAADHRRQPRGADRGRGADRRPRRWRACRATTRARLRRRSIGFVFQDFNLLAGLTAAENVALPLELDGTPRSHGARARRIDALDELGLAEPRRALPR